MKKLIWLVGLACFGCGGASESVVGSWLIYDPAMQKAAIIASISFTPEQKVKMKTSTELPNGSSVEFTLQGTYSMKANQLVVNYETIDMIAPPLAAETKAKFASLFDKDRVLTNAKKNRTSELSFRGKDEIQVKSSTGQLLIFKRSALGLQR